MPSSNTHSPDNILHALKHCESQKQGAYLGVCNHDDCQRPIEHGELVSVHAYYSERNGWHITQVYCRDHRPETAFDANHSLTTAIATAIFNHPADIPPQEHPVLSDFRLVRTTAERPQLEPPTGNTPNTSNTLESVLVDNTDTPGTQSTLTDWATGKKDTSPVTEPGIDLLEWFHNEHPLDGVDAEKHPYEELTEQEQHALDNMIDFEDLLNGDFTTEHSLENADEKDDQDNQD